LKSYQSRHERMVNMRHFIQYVTERCVLWSLGVIIVSKQVNNSLDCQATGTDEGWVGGDSQNYIVYGSLQAWSRHGRHNLKIR
jgi:hypothetical protein